MDRLVGMSLGSVAIGVVLEVGLEDGFQDQLDRALYHAVANRGYGKFSRLAVVFGYVYVLERAGTIGPALEFFLYFL